jgi:hypothetical protein
LKPIAIILSDVMDQPPDYNLLRRRPKGALPNSAQKPRGAAYLANNCFATCGV